MEWQDLDINLHYKCLIPENILQAYEELPLLLYIVLILHVK